LPGAKFTLRPSFAFAYILAALLHGSPAASVSQTLRRRTTYAMTELSQRAPPIFGRAAITLGMGPHSNIGLDWILSYHGLPNVNGDWLCHWEMAIFDPQQNQHPSTDQQKFVTGD